MLLNKPSHLPQQHHFATLVTTSIPTFFAPPFPLCLHGVGLCPRLCLPRPRSTYGACHHLLSYHLRPAFPTPAPYLRILPATTCLSSSTAFRCLCFISSASALALILFLKPSSNVRWGNRSMRQAGVRRMASNRRGHG